MKLPISAIVVGFNEGELLQNCFPALDFCDEIMYFDLGSSDNSIKIAESYNAKVFHHERVISCEWIHAKFADKTKHDWVLIIDPDEIIDKELRDEIAQLFNTGAMRDTVGAIYAPWLFYIKNKRLLGTPWGGVNKRILLVNNKRFTFTAKIHVGRELKSGYTFYDISLKKSNAIHHYWMRDYRQLVEKHLRYLKNEGEARFSIGKRTSLKTLLQEPIKAFYFGFIEKAGYKDGFLGFALSIFWAWYQTYAQLNLLRYQRSKIMNSPISR